MADIVGSLFGISVDDIRQQRMASRDAEAFAFSRMGKDQQDAFLGYKLGGAIADAGAKLFGVEDPMIKRQTDLESIMNETQQEANSDNPLEVYPILVKKLADKGYGKEALQVKQAYLGMAQAAELNQAKVDNENAQTVKYKAEALKALKQDDPNQKLFFELAKNASPQSVAKAIKAGFDVGMLDSPEKAKLSSFGQQLVDAGYTVGTPEFQAKMQEYLKAEMTGKSKGSGNVNVSLGGISIDNKKLSEEAGKKVGEAVADIEDQYAQLDDFAKAKSMLDEGIFSGQYADVEMQIAKGTRQNLKKVANTEKFKAYIANNVIKRLKDIGGNDTMEERQYLENMLAGNIQLEPEAIKSIIESGESKLRNIIARRKLQVESAATNGEIPLDPIKPRKRWNPQTKKLEEVK